MLYHVAGKTYVSWECSVTHWANYFSWGSCQLLWFFLWRFSSASTVLFSAAICEQVFWWNNVILMKQGEIITNITMRSSQSSNIVRCDAALAPFFSRNDFIQLHEPRDQDSGSCMEFMLGFFFSYSVTSWRNHCLLNLKFELGDPYSRAFIISSPQCPEKVWHKQNSNEKVSETKCHWRKWSYWSDIRFFKIT